MELFWERYAFEEKYTLDYGENIPKPTLSRGTTPYNSHRKSPPPEGLPGHLVNSPPVSCVHSTDMTITFSDSVEN